MNITVCVKQVVDTEAEKRLDPTTWCLDRSVNSILNPYDEYAVEEALRHQGGRRRRSGRPLHGAGRQPPTPSARRWRWAPTAACWSATRRLPARTRIGTAPVLAAALKKVDFDLVLFGSRSTDGETGCVPAAVAELLGLPAALLPVQGRGERQQRPRCTARPSIGYNVAYDCPCRPSLSVIKGINEPRYPSMKGIMGARKKPVDVRDIGALGLDASRLGLAGAGTRVTSATLPGPRKAGVVVEDDGSVAQKLAEFLATEKLV